MRKRGLNVLIASLLAGPGAAWAQCSGGACPFNYALPAPASAGPSVIQEPAPAAVARIVNQQQNVRTMGTGTLVSKTAQQGVVLTCAHLFREGVGTVNVLFSSAGQKSYAARVLAVDATWDLAALAIEPPDAAPLAVASAAPAPGESLTSGGFGPDGQFAVNHGQTLGYVQAAGTESNETLELSGAARLGDSGGPVLNGRQELVAVLFGTNGRVVDGTCCLRIREFLRRAGGSGTLSGDNNNSRSSAPPAPAAPVTSASPEKNNPDAGLLGKLQDDLKALQGENGGLRSRIEELIAAKTTAESGASSLQERLESLQARLAAAAPAVEEKIKDVAESPVGQAVEQVGLTALKGWLVANWGPLGLAVAGLLGGVVAYRHGKTRGASSPAKQSSAAPISPPPTNSPAPIAGAPAASTTLHENRYVPYESTAIDLAWSKAHAAIAQNYPGAVKYLGLVEQLKNRILSGENPSPPPAAS